MFRNLQAIKRIRLIGTLFWALKDARDMSVHPADTIKKLFVSLENIGYGGRHD